MIKAIIVDDEKKAVIVLRKLLQEYCPDINVVAEAGRVDKAIQLIEEHAPQLIFLDIEMPGNSGFDLLESQFIRSRGRNFHVIFVTAHSEFALKAFRFSVTDYLLKPVGIDELKQAVEKVRSLLDTSTSDATLNKKMEAPARHTLRIASPEGVIFVYFENIIRVEADGAYSHIYIDNGKRYMVSDHLKLIAEYLELPMFMRIHRSHIINLQKIKSIISKNGLFTEMADGSLIEVAKRNKADFLKKVHKKFEA